MDKHPEYQKAMLYDVDTLTVTTSGCLDKKNYNSNTLYPIEDFLDDMRFNFGHIYRTVYSKWNNDKTITTGEMKSWVVSTYNIKGRFANGIIKNVRTDRKARKENMSSRRNKLKLKVKKLKKRKKKLKNEVNKLHKENKNVLISGKLPKDFTTTLKELKQEIFKCDMKINKANQDINELSKQIDSGYYKICFGGRKLFYNQWNLDKNKKIKTKEEWLEVWRNKRNRHMYSLGSSDEHCGNQLIKLVYSGFNYFYITIADYRKGSKIKYTYPIKFDYLTDLLKENLNNGNSMSYNIVYDKNRYYIKPCLTIKKENITSEDNGCIGVDINNGFLAYSLVNKDGIMLDYGTINFTTESSSGDNKCTLSTAVKTIYNIAKIKNMSVAVEDINLSNKKMFNQGKRMNRLLHQFAYKRYLTYVERNIVDTGVPTYLVSPYFTSKLGERYINEEQDITRHTGASIIIARRSLGFIEWMDKEDEEE